MLHCRYTHQINWNAKELVDCFFFFSFSFLCVCVSRFCSCCCFSGGLFPSSFYVSLSCQKFFDASRCQMIENRVSERELHTNTMKNVEKKKSCLCLNLTEYIKHFPLSHMQSTNGVKSQVTALQLFVFLFEQKNIRMMCQFFCNKHTHTYQNHRDMCVKPFHDDKKQLNHSNVAKNYGKRLKFIHML